MFCLLHPVQGAQSHVWAFLIELAPRRPPVDAGVLSGKRREKGRERDGKTDFKVSYSASVFSSIS